MTTGRFKFCCNLRSSKEYGCLIFFNLVKDWSRSEGIRTKIFLVKFAKHSCTGQLANSDGKMRQSTGRLSNESKDKGCFTRTIAINELDKRISNHHFLPPSLSTAGSSCAHWGVIPLV